MFPNLPRGQLEKEVAKNQSSGESQEFLINKLLDEDFLIDLSGLEEEVEDLRGPQVQLAGSSGPGTMKCSNEN